MLARKYLKRAQSDRGFALLEYCAGAAIIAGVIWVALSNFGGSLSGMLNSLSSWAQARSGEIESGTTTSTNGGTTTAE